MATGFSLARFAAAPPLARARAIQQGLPSKAVRDLVADPSVSLAAVARVVGPRRTIDRRLREGGRLSPEESDRFARFLAILDLASGIFGSRAAAMAWLDTPKRRFEDGKPLDLLKSDAGARLVEDVLEQARHGFGA